MMNLNSVLSFFGYKLVKNGAPASTPAKAATPTTSQTPQTTPSPVTVLSPSSTPSGQLSSPSSSPSGQLSSPSLSPSGQLPLSLTLTSSTPSPRSSAAPKRRQKNAELPLRVAAESYILAASPSTRRNYLTALRSIAAFNDGKDVTLGQLREPFIIRYDRWLHARGVCRNTSSCYMRSLRALYNKVVDRMHLRDHRPFAHVYTGVDSTHLPVLQRKDIRRLRDLEIAPGTPMEKARDLFLFSLLAMGMPFIDVAFMRKSQIEGNTLVYYRHKTGQRVSVYLEPCMQQIIRKYSPAEGDYVFPLLSSTDPAVAYVEYESRLAAYNAQLSQLGRKAGLTQHLSSYTPRRTWASLAFQRDVSLETISQALGHTNSRTTRTYIKAQNDHLLRKKNKELLNYLSLDALGKRFGRFSNKLYFSTLC